MLALDLFNNDHERHLSEGAVDQLEQRRIDDLAMKMDDLVARAFTPTTTAEVKDALMKEFQKCKAERDSYYKIREAGIPGNVPGDKIPGKEDLLKGKGRTYYEDSEQFHSNRVELFGKINRVIQSIQTPEQYANALGFVKRAFQKLNSDQSDEPTFSSKAIQRVLQDARALERDLAAKAKELGIEPQGFLEAGIPGNIPADKIPGKEDLLKGKGRSYYEAQDQKKNPEITDPAVDRLLTTARHEFPKARSDAEALAMKILSKEQNDVDRLDQANRREDNMIAKLADFERNLQQQINHLTPTGELNEDQQLQVGDPIIVTAPNEFEGKTGEIAELSPSGKFVIVNLYNHGEQPMHLSDVEYNQYAADQEDEDDWYDDGAEDTLEEKQLDEAPARDILLGLLDKFYADMKLPPRQNSYTGLLDIKSPGTKVWTRGDGTRLRDPGRIKASYWADDKKQAEKAATNFWPWLLKQPGVKSIGQVSGQFGSSPMTDAVSYKGLYFSGGPYGTEFGSMSRVKNPKSVWRHKPFELEPKAEQGVAEGFQDFNRVEPYAVCLAGKPVKRFDYYEDARRFHDNWKKKLYREGDKAKADKITLMPLNLDEEGKGTPVPAKDFVKGVLKDLKKVNVKEQGVAEETREAELNRKFNTPDQLKKDADYRAYRAGVKASRKQPPKPLPEAGMGMWGDKGHNAKSQATKDLERSRNEKKQAAERARAEERDRAWWKSQSRQGEEIKEDWIDDNAAEPLARYFADLYYGDFSATEKVKLTAHIYQSIQDGKLSIEQLKADIDMLEKEKGITEGTGQWIVKYWDKQPENTPAEDKFGSEEQARAFLAKLPAHYVKALRQERSVAEVSDQTLQNYKDKAIPAFYDAVAKDNAKTANKRGQGISKASHKQARRAGGSYAFHEDVSRLSDAEYNRVAAYVRKKYPGTQLSGLGRNEDGSFNVMIDTGSGRHEFKVRFRDPEETDVNEAETDYSKRRQRERDVDAGKPVAKQRQSKMTDYQKRRAQQKREMELGESHDDSGVEQAILHRIMVAHTDLLKQFGPEKVMQAAEEVAYNVGDVDEIGTSDVSAYVNQVKQILGA